MIDFTPKVNPNKELLEFFLPTIFEKEAKGILHDLLLTPGMIGFAFADVNPTGAIEHIKGILEECYRAQHLWVMVANYGAELYGYALIFVHPDPAYTPYCHKIFFYEQYRGHGFGTAMVKELTSNPRGLCLLCNSDLMKFYEKAGMEYRGDYNPPASPHLNLARDCYYGTVLMSTPGASVASPVFMLNDDDVRAVTRLCLKSIPKEVTKTPAVKKGRK